MQVRFCGPDDENFAGVFEAISVLFLYILEHWKSFIDILAGIEMEE